MSTDNTHEPANGSGTPDEPRRPQAEQHAPEQHPAEQPTAPVPPVGQERPQPRYGQYAPGQTAQQPPALHPPHVRPSDPYAVPLGTVGGPGAPGGPGGPGDDPGRGPRGPRGWTPVVGAAVVAALVASGGTAALVGALDSDAPAALTDVGSSARETDSAPVASSTDQNPDWEAVTAAVAPSVVAIQVAGQQGGSEGSGVIYDDQGRIITNNHVVASAVQGGAVQVTLSDGRLYEAEIVGLDPTTDLAVVQIVDPPDDLVAASVGDSAAVRVGNAVLAVGNPLGLAHTATTGIVSALDRPVSAQGEGGGGEQVVTNAIQIDAAINPGNSGGPLFNAQGQVIGITSSIATLSSGLGGHSGSIGLGFAIPVNLATSIADQLIEDGTAEHAFLGVSLQDTTVTADGVTRRGAEVVEVSAGSPAAEAGLQPGDVVVALDDKPVNGAESLTASVRERSAGETATLTYVRDGQTRTADVTFAVREESAGSGQGGGQGGQGQGGSQGGTQEDQGGTQEDQGGQGSDPTQPGNLPGWLEDLFGFGG
ncbi:S1C family serine protease [Isoptericola variabilis]|uniref:Peptidase S1 and S6 chymotrypsin/Hap n=1 Tax=Isoptericola variabilis (strain 225) TaxID=743718 RepID=F6FV92_ISOV2|nr:trypsin-like peptidase domain-containing protein [Isoptericola variabilis]AEG43365.1 peptidase S1 and S6 chymotrypsin/Hap [Isoptericola variabilis 225]TWH34582.1 putative serine protease PepD [Isoptericola variabilis J7]